MLTIHFGDMDGVVYNTSVYFNNTYSGEWFSDPFAQKMIASADKGTVLGPNAIEAKTMGVVPPEKLSSGLKMLLLMYFLPERAYNASNRGDNWRSLDSCYCEKAGHQNQLVPPCGFRWQAFYCDNCQYG